ncbi:MAG TPA: hypothetical protein VMF13_10585 [Luteitalea sp.]|nr:hypothetical protein [Luteitalea sp.]
MRAAILAVVCWVVSCGLVHADAAAPRRPGEPPPARGSILRPVVITVTPTGVVAPPDRIVVYVAREHLQAMLGQTGESAAGQEASTGTPAVYRHVIAAVALAMALLSLPFLLGRKGTGAATAAALLGAAVATAWFGVPVAAVDIATPGVRRTRPPGPPPQPNPQASKVTPTIEITVKPGLVQPTVQLFYRRP